MAAPDIEVHLDGDTIVRLRNLKNESTGNLESGAAVTFDLIDEGVDPEVVLITADPMPAVVGTPGGYDGEIPDTLALTKGQRLRVDQVANQGGLVKHFILHAVVVE